MTNNDTLRLEYVPLSQAVLWDKNPKRHDIGAIITSIKRHGFKDPPKYEPTLNGGKGGAVEGNGRIVCLQMMLQDGGDVPRGIQRLSEDDWAVPILFGVDAASEKAAEAYAIDHNNLVMAGGDFTAFDIAGLWEQDDYTAILAELAIEDLFPVSVTGEDVDGLVLEEKRDIFSGADLPDTPQIEETGAYLIYLTFPDEISFQDAIAKLSFGERKASQPGQRMAVLDGAILVGKLEQGEKW